MAVPLVSLIVPTYRRPDDLRRCLASVRRQTLPGFEVVVVDNAADPAVAAAVDDLNRASRVPVRYVPEARLGLHNARHAGVRASSGDLLVFTDDDATFDPDWLAAHARAFAAHPEMAAAGGPVRPVWEAQPPAWLLAFLATQPAMFPDLSLLDLHREFVLAPDGLFFGVNMAVRRGPLVAAGGFNPDSFGRVWLGDGESGLNRALWRQGALVGYVPDALVFHHVPPERMTLAYLRRRQANDGACDVYARYHDDGVPGPLGLAGAALGIVRESARDWAAAVVLRGRTDPRALRVQMRAARARARLGYVLRLMRDPRLRELVARRDWLANPPPDSALAGLAA